MKENVLRAAAVLMVVAVALTLAPSPAMATGQAGTTLSADKTATGHMKRVFTWTIEKTVTPDSWDLFNGDTGTSQYTVTVEKGAGTDTYVVTGEVCVTNGGAFATESLSIMDEVQYKVGSGQFQTLTSSQVGLGGYGTLDPGESHCYEYSVSFTPVAGAIYRNVAHVTITNHAGWMPGGNNCPGPATCPFGPDPKADFSLPSTPDQLVNDSINVDDTNGESWAFNDSGSVSYSTTFECGDDVGNHGNTATIRETGQSDDASVVVNCYALEVTKTAVTSFTRAYHWEIEKSADHGDGDPGGNNVEALNLSAGQQHDVNYSVSVNLASPPSTDSDWAVNGAITIANPAPIAAALAGVDDTVSPDIGATVTCPSLIVPAGETLECTYEASLPDAAPGRVNTATATLQNYDYDYQGSGTASGTTDFSGTAGVVFSDEPTEEIDECVTVSDDKGHPENQPAEELGQVCAGETLPKVFTYAVTSGPYGDNECGNYLVTNTASFVAVDDDNDTGATGDDSWTVAVKVGGCPSTTDGCTLTPGYWKTHSEYGPAPYDDNWMNLLPMGEDSLFFLSGQTYYQVLWTAPQGNAYYILAHAYIAAKLNMLNGAGVPEAVEYALEHAELLFGTYSPAQIAALKGKNATVVRADFIGTAAILDQYNNGLAEEGPPHCSE